MKWLKSDYLARFEKSKLNNLILIRSSLVKALQVIMTSTNKAIELQLQVKQNAEELQDFMRDLENWEKDIKQKDMEL